MQTRRMFTASTCTKGRWGRGKERKMQGGGGFTRDRLREKFANEKTNVRAQAEQKSAAEFI